MVVDDSVIVVVFMEASLRAYGDELSIQLSTKRASIIRGKESWIPSQNLNQIHLLYL